MSTRFPIIPVLTAGLLTGGAALVVHQHRAEHLAKLQQQHSAAARPAQIPVPVIRAPRVPAERLRAIAQRFSQTSSRGLDQLRAFESLSREELIALLLANEPPWEGVEILPWKLKLFARYAELDAAAALRLAGSAFAEPHTWLMAVRPLLLRWVAADAPAAAAWWRALAISREPLSGSSAWREIDAAMDEAAPDSAAWAKFTAALEAVPNQLPADKQARRAAREAIDNARTLAWSFRSGPARGRVLAAFLSNGSGRSELYGVPDMAASWADDEPVQARAWLDGILPRQPDAATLAPAMALQNLRNNYRGLPSDAVDYALWAQAVHPAGCTPDWWAELVRSNAPNRATIAAALLQAIPADTDHDPAILAWLEHSESPAADTAAALLAQINDPAKRAAAAAIVTGKQQRADTPDE